jgi:hypothetical protein
LYYKNSKSSSEIKFICNFFQIEGIYDFTLDKNNQINTVIRKEEPESEDKQGKKQNEIPDKEWSFGVELFYSNKN